MVTLPSPYVPAVYLSTSVCFWGLGGWGGGGGGASSDPIHVLNNLLSAPSWRCGGDSSPKKPPDGDGCWPF